MVLQKIKSLEQVQVVESLFRRKSLRFRELTNSGNGPCYLLFHIKKYTKKFLRVKTNVLFVAKTSGVLWYFGQTKPRRGGVRDFAVAGNEGKAPRFEVGSLEL